MERTRETCNRIRVAGAGKCVGALAPRVLLHFCNRKDEGVGRMNVVGKKKPSVELRRWLLDSSNPCRWAAPSCKRLMGIGSCDRCPAKDLDNVLLTEAEAIEWWENAELVPEKRPIRVADAGTFGVVVDKDNDLDWRERTVCSWALDCEGIDGCKECPANTVNQRVTHDEALEWWRRQKI